MKTAHSKVLLALVLGFLASLFPAQTGGAEPVPLLTVGSHRTCSSRAKDWGLG